MGLARLALKGRAVPVSDNVISLDIPYKYRAGMFNPIRAVVLEALKFIVISSVVVALVLRYFQ